ncbi:MAG: MBL fold metallo-hydrolase [Pseudomonadota bacterium]
MSIPFVHAPDLKPGVCEKLSERIFRIIAPNPGPFTYTGSGTYIVTGADACVVIDPGPDDPEHVDRIVSEAPSPIAAILITHTHKDHCGGAPRLNQKTGAATYGFGTHPNPKGLSAPALDEGADFDFAPDHQLTDGQRLSIAGVDLNVVHTPGHISNHICFALDKEHALFTGDHIMGWATTVVAPPDGNMTDYMASLEKLLIRNDRVYYPTHGAPIHDPQAFTRAVQEHRRARDRAILKTLDAGPQSIAEIVDTVYVGLAEPLKLAAGLNVRAHLDAHTERGLVEEENGLYRLTAAG